MLAEMPATFKTALNSSHVNLMVRRFERMIMKKEFTDGPWEVLNASNYDGFAIAPRGTLPTLAACERFGKVMTINCFNFPGSTEANANLIASAPELFDSLVEMVELYELTGNPIGDVVRKAERALLKATRPCVRLTD